MPVSPFPPQYDHAVLNFGKVKNLDTYNPTPTDKEPSTIRVFFTAILIKNTAYTNDTVIVTAGAEYDSERYVWVSQASHSYTMTPVSGSAFLSAFLSLVSGDDEGASRLGRFCVVLFAFWS